MVYQTLFNALSQTTEIIKFEAMMKHLRPFLAVMMAIAVSLTISAQPDARIPEGEVTKDFNVTDAKGLKQGLWVKVYKNGQLYYKGSFKNDIPQGTFWFWYDSGEPMREVVHLDGTNHMEAKHYHRNGKLMSEGTYRQGFNEEGQPDKVRDGEWKFYDEEGYLKSVEHYKLGAKHGVAKTYYDTGKLLREEEFVNGKQEGKFTEYYENGRVRALRQYRDGTFHGEMKIFAADGTSILQGTYENGRQHGVWIEFNDSGKIKMTTKYNNGEVVATRRENGEFTDYYPNGIPKSHYTFENGKKNGPFSEWFEQGEWVREPMDAPMPGGGIQFKEKLINTQVHYEGDYLDDKLEGIVTWYNEQGRVMKIEEYVNGELISTKEK